MSGGFYWTPKSFGGIVSQTVRNDEAANRCCSGSRMFSLAGPQVDLRGVSETEWSSGPTTWERLS